MKAITILQPWASLIACGAKKIETRSWATKYRGSIAIHAGKGMQFADLSARDPFFPVLWNAEQIKMTHKQRVKTLPYGKVIAIADLVDCVLMDAFNFGTDGKVNGVWLVNGDCIEGNELAFGNYEPGRYAWILDNVRRIEPVPAKGMQRLWEWEGVLA